ncbi:MAG: phosphoribosylanthranilate isomerase [Deltaproteobacteria bacterium]|nr:phosphoribosylanthranilate isomerase [Deltaproteobacteria bacterium]
MVKVKICGITNYEDASLAVELGADILGFILAPSPRQISPEKVRSIIGFLPPFVMTVGVFVDEEEKTIKDIADFCRLTQVQLHGKESPDFCRRFRPKALKAFRVLDETSLLPISTYQGHVQAVILDTYQKGMAGGTGRTFPWDLAIKAKAFNLPVFLSGGLNPSNIRQAIATVKPYGVDVNSGIEERPGKKDPLRMKQLMKVIKESRVREPGFELSPHASSSSKAYAAERGRRGLGWGTDKA